MKNILFISIIFVCAACADTDTEEQRSGKDQLREKIDSAHVQVNDTSNSDGLHISKKPFSHS